MEADVFYRQQVRISGVYRRYFQRTAQFLSSHGHSELAKMVIRMLNNADDEVREIQKCNRIADRYDYKKDDTMNDPILEFYSIDSGNLLIQKNDSGDYVVCTAKPGNTQFIHAKCASFEDAILVFNRITSGITARVLAKETGR